MAAPLVEINTRDKTFILISQNKNKFVTSFLNKDSKLVIKSLFDDGIVKTFYEAEYSLTKIQGNKALSIYDSIKEVFDELISLINQEKIHLIEENDKNALKIIFDLPSKKYNSIEFSVGEKKNQKMKK